MSAARDLAGLLASGPPLLYPAIKATLRATEHLDFRSAMNLVNREGVPEVATLYSSEDMLEGARAFSEKRDPVWRGR